MQPAPTTAAAAAAPTQTLAGFQGVAGHAAHVQALKEMVLLPLVYPEVFKSMQVGGRASALPYSQSVELLLPCGDLLAL